MAIKIYQVDAFTNQAFSGNPAAVCVLEKEADKVGKEIDKVGDQIGKSLKKITD